MYKNWKAICQITDIHFMWALALLDLATEFGRMVAERFPEYFSNEQQAGPIPLSALRIIARQNCQKIGEQFGWPEDHLVSYEAIPEDWPILFFGDEDTVKSYPKFKLIPEELKTDKPVGTIHEWQGKKLVLVEAVFVAGDEWNFVPAELIAVDK